MNYKNFQDYKDMYNIYYLITKINSNYRLKFDTKNKLFVVLNIAKNNQICYKTDIISANTLNYLQKTRIENIDFIFKNIEQENMNLLNKKQELFKNEVREKSVDVISLSKRTSYVSRHIIDKIIGESV